MRANRTATCLIAVLAAWSLPPVAARAQEAPPAAREIIDRYIQAIGGEAAVRRASSWKASGTLSMPAAGISGTLVAYMADGRSMARITLPGLGEILRGYDSGVGWSVNPLEGPRLLEGRELAQARDEAQPGTALRDSTVIAAMETVGRDEMNGEPCWKVKLVWNSDRTTHDCYSIETGLLVGSTGVTSTAVGDFEYTMLVGEYRTFGDVKIATRVVQQSLGQEQVITTDAVEIGPVDPSVFALPPGIEALKRAR